MCSTCGCDQQTFARPPEDTELKKRSILIEEDVLARNDAIAAANRRDFSNHRITALNLVSSPGSGKTTLLCATLEQLKARHRCQVFEGDQQTSHDADRIAATQVPVLQINTGKGCHLDAQMITDACNRLRPAANSFLFIENVGNLVCPAAFDLGEKHKVAILSVTEGEDKPIKYPYMFAAASLIIINKTDLLPHLDFDIETCIANARRVNPEVTIITLSALTGEGMDHWLGWLEEQTCV